MDNFLKVCGLLFLTMLALMVFSFARLAFLAFL